MTKSQMIDRLKKAAEDERNFFNTIKAEPVVTEVQKEYMTASMHAWSVLTTLVDEFERSKDE